MGAGNWAMLLPKVQTTAECDDQPGGTGAAAAGSKRGRAFIGRAGSAVWRGQLAGSTLRRR